MAGWLSIQTIAKIQSMLIFADRYNICDKRCECTINCNVKTLSRWAGRKREMEKEQPFDMLQPLPMELHRETYRQKRQSKSLHLFAGCMFLMPKFKRTKEKKKNVQEIDIIFSFSHVTSTSSCSIA